MNGSTHCREEMKRDLLKVYREVCSSYECRNNWEAWERVVQHEAPRFYVDARWALQVLAPMMRGDRSKLESLSPLKREMYEALYDTVLRLWQKSSFWGKSLNYVLPHAIKEPAPRFYIKTVRMGQIWREAKRKRGKN